VYEYLPRPSFCRKCLEYGHREKFCEGMARCSKCSSHQHSTANCDSPAIKCLQCDGAHKTGDRACKRQRQEEEINAIKYRERLSWNDARTQYFAHHPDEQNDYADIVKKQRRPERLATTARTIPEEEEVSTSSRTRGATNRHQMNVMETSVIACEDAVRPKAKRVESSSGDEMELRTKKKGRIDDRDAESSDNMDELEQSSETNSKIRKEVEQIYNEYSLKK